MKIRLIILLICCTAAAHTHAACNKTSCTGMIDRLYVDAANLHVQLQGLSAGLPCRFYGNRYISSPNKHPMFKEWHGMLLGAFLSGIPANVRVVTSRKTRFCEIEYVVLDRPKTAKR